MNPVSTYQAARVNGASPARLVVMLYDRLIRSVDEGRTALAEGRTVDAQAPLLKAQRILTELITALNPEGGEVTTNLHDLYVYTIATIEKAKTGADSSVLDGPAGILENLRGGWLELAGRGDAEVPAGMPGESLVSVGGYS